MSVMVKINDTDRSSLVLTRYLKVERIIDEVMDSCSFKIRKNSTIDPAFLDDIKIYDGADLIFGGVIVDIEYDYETVSEKGVLINIKALDYSYLLEKRLISKTYEDETIHDIIADMLATNATEFDADNSLVDIVIDKVVFNQVSISQAIKRLADLLNYRWFVDVNKSVNLFEKEKNSAPEDLTDTSGNYVYKSLKRKASGAQLVNRVKIRGGEYEGEVYTDSITVSGNATKSFQLPYKMANLTVKLNTVSQSVGVDFINDFTDKDVLYNYNNQSFRFETALTAGDVIEFGGNPKIRVFAIAEDSDSRNAYDVHEKMLRDNDITSNTIARKRASAELYAYAQPLVDASFFTYNKFLEVGMSILLNKTVSNSSDTLIISKLTYKMLDPNTFGYKVELVSNKRLDLISMLSKLLQPDSLGIDETETSEEIFADNASIQIQEDIEVVTPVEDFESVEMQEEILVDPFDPANIVWVFGYYFPISDSDPKRMAKFDRDATFS